MSTSQISTHAESTREGAPPQSDGKFGSHTSGDSGAMLTAGRPPGPEPVQVCPDEDPSPKTWVGCRGCYTEGEVVGDWYEATNAANVSVEQLHGNEGIESIIVEHSDQGAKVYQALLRKEAMPGRCPTPTEFSERYREAHASEGEFAEAYDEGHESD